MNGNLLVLVLCTAFVWAPTIPRVTLILKIYLNSASGPARKRFQSEELVWLARFSHGLIMSGGLPLLTFSRKRGGGGGGGDDCR